MSIGARSRRDDSSTRTRTESEPLLDIFARPAEPSKRPPSRSTGLGPHAIALIEAIELDDPRSAQAALAAGANPNASKAVASLTSKKVLRVRTGEPVLLLAVLSRNPQMVQAVLEAALGTGRRDQGGVEWGRYRWARPLDAALHKAHSQMVNPRGAIVTSDNVHFADMEAF
ncbi:hypothetical protein M427DRAFT_68551 [Gonapodya prolifera JEL478]|uniref:Ankyrin n=1 Tax=Gonapodya prolifera (strain JEL478) TaxID=1344416 RepID=A0A139AK03_GONPJ|nr:hypothetical protein M427DRAFT_68551 [Gonapodya prolifera JEL478]|eukprot:KXS17107.1 hypothetical protein M427DRAFT_68551 [Gonapodya prolifera JEL478]